MRDFLDNYFDWVFDSEHRDRAISVAIGMSKDRSNRLVRDVIPDHGNGAECLLMPARPRVDGLRTISGVALVPYGTPTRFDSFTADRVDRIRLDLTEDGRVWVTLLSWGNYEFELDGPSFAASDGVVFFEEEDSLGRRGQFALGVLREHNGVRLVGMAFDRTKVTPLI